MSLKVLLADDDNVAVFLQKIIILESKLTNDLLTFSNGQEIIEFLNNDSPSPDIYLVFLDINMPVMGGIDFLENINEGPFRDRVRVALVSSYSVVRDNEAANKYPQVICVYEKPVTIETCNKILLHPSIISHHLNT